MYASKHARGTWVEIFSDYVPRETYAWGYQAVARHFLLDLTVLGINHYLWGYASLYTGQDSPAATASQGKGFLSAFLSHSGWKQADYLKTSALAKWNNLPDLEYRNLSYGKIWVAISCRGTMQTAVRLWKSSTAQLWRVFTANECLSIKLTVRELKVSSLLCYLQLLVYESKEMWSSGSLWWDGKQKAYVCISIVLMLSKPHYTTK